jgi:eukaryotic-like serine/threonine-protein kinase
MSHELDSEDPSSQAGPDSESPAQERIGTVLDEKWTLERALGSGGMGAVYAARHRNGARGAVKVLHPELARRVDVRERFLREGYAANRVEHRGAVRVLDDQIIKEGPDEGTAYLVMELLEGESLEERIERGPPLTEPELLAVLDDVLAVLEAAHEHGVVHRDLKPANLFLNRDPAGPRVKVLDFGLARLEELHSGTSAGLALGTPSFMAPEQASGRQTEIDARCDIFAVGATAFMILANRGVHEAEGVLELVARMGTLPAPKLRQIAPHVSETVAAIIDRALEFEREDRYPSAAAMRADVQRELASRASAPIVLASIPGALTAATRADAAGVAKTRADLPGAAKTRADLPGAAKTRADGPGALTTRADGLGAGTPRADGLAMATTHMEPSSAEAAAPPAARGASRAWLAFALLVALGLATLALVPRARELSGLDGALAQMMPRGARTEGGGATAPSAAPTSRVTSGEPHPAAAMPVAAITDAAPEELVVDLAAATSEPDAGADADVAEDAGLDAGDAGADEEEDEDDDDDAGGAVEVAAPLSSPHASAPGVAAGASPAAAHHAAKVTKRPRASPRGKHKGPRRPHKPRRR